MIDPHSQLPTIGIDPSEYRFRNLGESDSVGNRFAKFTSSRALQSPSIRPRGPSHGHLANQVSDAGGGPISPELDASGDMRQPGILPVPNARENLEFDKF